MERGHLRGERTSHSPLPVCAPHAIAEMLNELRRPGDDEKGKIGADCFRFEAAGRSLGI